MPYFKRIKKMNNDYWKRSPKLILSIAARSGSTRREKGGKLLIYLFEIRISLDIMFE